MGDLQIGESTFPQVLPKMKQITVIILLGELLSRGIPR